MPGFLTSALPNITSTLLALDISCNMLPALPPALASCTVLEELNIAANPLRVLPTWLSQLASLRVFIADSTGISNLPQSMHMLTSLHTLSIRKNRLYSLPAWLSHLTTLETLLVDGNPFLEPWSSLVAPILEGSNRPAPVYPPLTPPTATVPTSTAALSTPDSSNELPITGSSFFPPTPLHDNRLSSSPDPPLRRSLSQPQARRPNVESAYGTPPVSRSPSSAAQVVLRPPSPRSRSGSTSKSSMTFGMPSMSRPRTAPVHTPPASAPIAKAALVGSYLSMLDSTLPSPSSPTQKSSSKTSATSDPGRKTMRRMKSADELSRLGQFSRPPTSAPLPTNEEVHSRRFESLPRGGPVGSRNGERSRVPLTMWADSSAGSSRQDVLSSASDPRPTSVATSRPDSRAMLLDDAATSPNEETAEKGKRWGFLKKMSMGRMRSATAPREQHRGAAPSRQGVLRAHTTLGRTASPLPPGSPMRSPSLGAAHGSGRPDPVHANSAPVAPRIAEDGMLLPPLPPTAPLTPNFTSQGILPAITVPLLEEDEPTDAGPSTLELRKKSSREAMALLSPPQGPPRTPSPNHLSPIATRAQKRRSFLPLASAATTGSFDIPVPSPGPFVQDPPVSGLKDDASRADRDSQGSQYLIVPAPPNVAQEAQEIEQHHIREQYKNGLRSVMSYLRDLSDLSGPLGVSELGPPGSPSASQAKRRPTITSDSRVASEGSMGSLNGSPGLSKKPSMASLSGAALSITTSESSGLGNIEDRKYKEDKNKRVKIINEIVA